jgi:nicotinamide-nucleotide amidase
MKIEIINTGSELLLGRVLNSHGHWFGRELFGLGLRVDRQVTVPDDAIHAALEEAVQRADAVLVTGGLGPTSDDLTREAAAAVMGLELIEDEAALRSLEAYFAERELEMAPENRRQAQVPVGADVLPNAHGTAPGIYIPPRLNGAANCAVFLLPGPPRELYPMFHDEVVPRLRSLGGIESAAGMRELRFTGIGESEIHRRVDADLAGIDGLEVGYCARPGEVDVRLIGADEAVERGRRRLLEAFGEACFSEDGSSLEEVVVRRLAARGWTLATAESCTGGLIASRVTDVPGASEAFRRGLVTYADEAKVDLLGVSAADLAAQGAVSEAVAGQMAEGARRAAGAEIAVAVTGIAGPGGGSAEKPVGTVFLALAVQDRPTEVIRQIHRRERKAFKLGVSQAALDLVRRALEVRTP